MSPELTPTAINLWQSPRLRADLILLLAAMLWGGAFVAQRYATFTDVNLFAFNGIRYTLGALSVLCLAYKRLREITRQELLAGTIFGGILFSAVSLQQAGLQYTTAGKAGFITGLYVIQVPICMALFRRQRPPWSAWVGSITAVVGLFLLSSEGKLSLSFGDSLVLVSSIFWTYHILIIGALTRQVNFLRAALVQFLICALLNAVVGLYMQPVTLPALGAVMPAVVYTGIFSIGGGFTLQVAAQRAAPETDSAIILSLEAVFATLFGWLILNERPMPSQLFGSSLMLAGMLFSQAYLFIRSQPPSRNSV